MASPINPAGIGGPPRPSSDISVTYHGPLHELLAVYERANQTGKLHASFEAQSGHRGEAKLLVHTSDHWSPVLQEALDALRDVHEFAVESGIAQ